MEVIDEAGVDELCEKLKVKLIAAVASFPGYGEAPIYWREHRMLKNPYVDSEDYFPGTIFTISIGWPAEVFQEHERLHGPGNSV